MTLPMNQDDKRRARKDIARVNRFTFLYTLIFTLFTFSAMVAGAVPLIADDPNVALEKVQEVLTEQSGVTSLTALVFGALFVLAARRGRLFREDLRAPERRTMTARVFFCAIVLFFTCQVLYIGLDPIVRWVAAQFGYSLYSTGDSLAEAPNDLAMILYAGFLGPVMEEVVFRGVVLRGLAKYGKLFAIVTSAALFGLFHADIVQGVFAFAAGLIFGYIAMEYGILWSIALHIFNNFVLADLFARAFALLPASWQDPAQIAVIFGIGLIGGALVLWKNRAALADYIRTNHTAKGLVPLIWTTPSLWLFILMEFAMIVTAFTKVG